MTRTKLITICLLILSVCGILWGYIGLKEEAQELQKMVDTQREILYNKDSQIEEMTVVISKQEQELIKSAETIKQLEDKKSRFIEVKVVHYSSEGTGSTLTASGKQAQVGRTIACNFLPFGTKVRIDGHEYIVEDRGGMTGNMVDVYVGSMQEAIQKGAYYTTMEVLQ